MSALGRGCAQACIVALVDDGAMQDVSPGGEEEVVGWVLLEAEGLERRESVDGGDDRLLFKGRDGHMVVNRGGDFGDRGLRRRRCCY